MGVLHCLAGCHYDHAEDTELHICEAVVGSVTVPCGPDGPNRRYQTVSVAVHRDLNLDGSLHLSGVRVDDVEDPLPVAAARELAWLVLAAADRGERGN